jgi:hypothetical protein
MLVPSCSRRCLLILANYSRKSPHLEPTVPTCFQVSQRNIFEVRDLGLDADRIAKLGRECCAVHLGTQGTPCPARGPSPLTLIAWLPSTRADHECWTRAICQNGLVQDTAGNPVCTPGLASGTGHQGPCCLCKISVPEKYLESKFKDKRSSPSSSLFSPRRRKSSGAGSIVDSDAALATSISSRCKGGSRQKQYHWLTGSLEGSD